MTVTKPDLVVSISTRALFDAEVSHSTFVANGAEAFVSAEVPDSRAPYRPGVGFQIIKHLHDWSNDGVLDVRIVVVSRRDPASGARILRSLSHHGLRRAQGSFTSGVQNLTPYLQAFETDLFLSLEEHDVQAAVNAGIPAAQISGAAVPVDDGLFRIAVDGDAVLFSDHSERYFREQGLEAFLDREHTEVDVPMPLGPIMPFIQKLAAVERHIGRRLTRLALVTARQGLASERAMRTLAAHGVVVDEAHFCGNSGKTGILKAFGPHLFFDDSQTHLVPASGITTAAKVPWVSAEPEAAPFPS